MGTGELWHFVEHLGLERSWQLKVWIGCLAEPNVVCVWLKSHRWLLDCSGLGAFSVLSEHLGGGGSLLLLSDSLHFQQLLSVEVLISQQNLPGRFRQQKLPQNPLIEQVKVSKMGQALIGEEMRMRREVQVGQQLSKILEISEFELSVVPDEAVARPLLHRGRGPFAVTSIWQIGIQD